MSLGMEGEPFDLSGDKSSGIMKLNWLSSIKESPLSS